MTAITIAAANQKGGVGKTTTVQSLASELVGMGKKVLCIDLDPQGNLSLAMDAAANGKTIMDVLNGTPIKEAIQSTPQGDIITTNVMLADVEATFINRWGKEFFLRDQIRIIQDDYDFILIDTRPSLGLLLVMALVAAEEVIIPVAPEIFSAQGLTQLIKTIGEIQQHFNPNLHVAGLLMTRYTKRQIVDQENLEMIMACAAEAGVEVFNTKIRNSSLFKVAQKNLQSIQSVKRRSAKGPKEDYADFTKELLGLGA